MCLVICQLRPAYHLQNHPSIFYNTLQVKYKAPHEKHPPSIHESCTESCQEIFLIV